MRANAKAIDLVPLLIQAEDGVLVDVVRCHDGQFVEPRNLEPLRHLLEGLPRQTGEIGQVPGVDPYAQCMVAQVVQGQGHGTEVQQTTPTEKTTGPGVQ